jgi:ribosomal protein L11 methyltransferase
VHATDIDPQASIATRDNALANECAVEVLDIDRAGGVKAEIVVANILTNPLKVLAPALVGHVAPGGQLTLSGILEEQEAEVIAAYAPLISLARYALEDGWTCVTGVANA